MAPSFFSGGTRETSSVKYFEIRLDESIIVLRGDESEASSAVLKGTLVLCLSEPLRIQAVRLRFTGEKRLGWYSSGSGINNTKHEEEFLRRTWEFKRFAETLPAGNYEWPFDMILSGETAESVEGLPDTWIIYRMKATIERGMLQQNAVARKQVRIIRTLEPDSLELAHAMSVDNIWPEKLEYSLSTPTKAVIFGSNIRVDFKLIPLLKGLRIGKIITDLCEKQELALRGSRLPARNRSISRLIASDEYKLPVDAETEDIDGQEGYVFARNIPVPQSLKQCIQTVDALGVKIRHCLTFNVQLHNPDGHVSELHATLPVYIILSPNLPIDDNHDLITKSQRSTIAATGFSDLTPPQYGEHHFDQLYSDIDPSGYVTPGGGASGLNTPFVARSRSVSTENLASMNALTSSSIAANVLHYRLNNLDAAGATYTARDRPLNSGFRDDLADHGAGDISRPDDAHTPHSSYPNDVFPTSTGGSPQQRSLSDVLSRQPSDENGARSGRASPLHVEYSAETLAKVPSYTTALRSNPRTPVKDGLPSYQTATRIPLLSPPRAVHLP